MSTFERTKQEIWGAFHDQVELLETSCRLYDEGSTTEAVRIASCVFILVNDGSQRSLLTQTGLKKKLDLISYASKPVPGNFLSEQPLTIARASESMVRYEPHLDVGPTSAKYLKFGKWWDTEKVFIAPTGQSLTRRGLVFAMRNQDGGAHFDPRLTDEAYVRFSRKQSWSVYTNGREILPTPRQHEATMRHIGFELLKSIGDCKSLIADAEASLGPLDTPGSPVQE